MEPELPLAPQPSRSVELTPGGTRDAADLRDVIAWLATADLRADAAVAAKGRLLVLDTLGCVIAALARPILREFAGSLARVFPGTVQLPGATTGLGPAGVAALAATAACWDEACEGLAGDTRGIRSIRLET